MLQNIRKTISEAIKALEKQEKAQDKLLVESRLFIRKVSLAVKAIHARELDDARKSVKELEAQKRELLALSRGLEHLTNQAMQEYTEVAVLLAAVESKEIPGAKQLGVPVETYFTGLCDVIGELRREMLEALKRGDKKEAKRLFDLAQGIYEELSVLRFSNSLLPSFRKKQDVARGQVEHARSELLRSIS